MDSTSPAFTPLAFGWFDVDTSAETMRKRRGYAAGLRSHGPERASRRLFFLSRRHRRRVLLRHYGAAPLTTQRQPSSLIGVGLAAMARRASRRLPSRRWRAGRYATPSARSVRGQPFHRRDSRVRLAGHEHGLRDPGNCRRLPPHLLYYKTVTGARRTSGPIGERRTCGCLAPPSLSAWSTPCCYGPLYCRLVEQVPRVLSSCSSWPSARSSSSCPSLAYQKCGLVLGL